MDLSHEEKLIAMKGFQAGMEKEAYTGAARNVGKAIKDIAESVTKTVSRQSGKASTKVQEVGSKGKAFFAGATGKSVGSAGRTQAGINAGHTAKGQVDLYNKGKKVYDHRGKIIAGTGVGGTALVMND